MVFPAKRSNTMENAESIKKLFYNLDQSEKKLRPGQLEIIKSLKKQFKSEKSLSHSQIGILEDIQRFLLFYNTTDQKV